MKLNTSKIILIIAAAFFPLVAFGATYTISQNGSGVDYSIAEFNALKGDKGGDIYYFSGTITTRVRPKIYGTSGNPVVLDGYQAGDCDWIGTGSCSGSAVLEQTSGEALWICDNHDYITVQDFEIHGSNYSGSSALVRVNDISDVATSDHILFGRNYLHDASASLMNVQRQYKAGANGRGDYLTLKENKIVNAAKHKNASEFINLNFYTNVLVEDNILGHSGSSKATSSNILAFHDCDYVLVENNIVYGAPNGAGITFKEDGDGCQNLLVRFNKTYDHDSGQQKNAGRGFSFGKYVANAYVYGNYSYSNASQAISVHDAARDIWIWSNIFANNGAFGLNTYKRTGPGNNINIFNNTFYRNADTDSKYNNTTIYFGDSGATNISVKNNLLIEGKPGTHSYYHQISAIAGVTGDIDSDYNTFYHSNNLTYAWYYNGDYRTLATMDSSYGMESNSNESDPGFNDANGADNKDGTEDDDYTLDGNHINNGFDLSQCFSVTIQGRNYKPCLDDALNPETTDWTTNPPTVNTTKQDVHGSGWERGAYVYIESKRKK
jgi:hypothetical protein